MLLPHTCRVYCANNTKEMVCGSSIASSSIISICCTKGVLSRRRRREGMQLPYGYLEGEMLVVTKNRSWLACHDSSLWRISQPTPPPRLEVNGWVGTRRSQNTCLWSGEVDLDTLIFQEGRIQRKHSLILPPCLWTTLCWARTIGSSTASTSRRADKTSTSAIRIQCHLNSPFFSQSW